MFLKLIRASLKTARMCICMICGSDGGICEADSVDAHSVKRISTRKLMIQSPMAYIICAHGVPRIHYRNILAPHGTLIF